MNDGSDGSDGREKLGNANPNVGKVGRFKVMLMLKFRLNEIVGSVGRLGSENDGSAKPNVGSVGS
jgi:hypothetical protein